MPEKSSRRRFLRTLGVGLAGLASGAALTHIGVKAPTRKPPGKVAGDPESLARLVPRSRARVGSAKGHLISND